MTFSKQNIHIIRIGIIHAQNFPSGIDLSLNLLKSDTAKIKLRTSQMIFCMKIMKN